ncbi:Phospholipid methyltransferase [Candidatus Burarchaeum australiense]|nr:Phospholipid methyltransferase [Candidatus Burarchaeum australiense]
MAELEEDKCASRGKLAGLKKKMVLIYLAAAVVIGLMFFVPAGTLDYWQAWLYGAVVLIPPIFVLLYFLKKDPEFLEKRMKTKEKENRQRLIIKIALVLFLISFLIPGLDHRYHWSDVPVALVLAADAIILLSYALIFLVFRENHYASRVVEVQKGQKVISTGPYAIIRHPMYLGTMLMYLFTPLALGSYWAVLPFFIMILAVIIPRILNEEEVLRRDLPGYAEYCQKVRYRLIPHVW